jgi:hypothetical protein
MASEQTILLFAGGTTPRIGNMMSEVYESYKENYGFL